MDQITQRCRLCLESGKSFITSMHDVSFRARLAAVSNFMFEDNEQLPSEVCSECSTKVTQFCTFMETVRCHQEQLHQSLAPIQVKNEIMLEPSDQELEPIGQTGEQSQSPKLKSETTDVKIEMHTDEDPPAVEKSEDEEVEEPESSYENEEFDSTENREEESLELKIEAMDFEVEKPESMEDEDGLIKEFFNMQCDTCSETFETFEQLSSHTDIVHDKPAVLECCDRGFTCKNKMLLHVKMHLKWWKCDDCGKQYSYKHDLIRHQRGKHAINEEKPYQCEKCSYSFESSEKLRLHRRSHYPRVECPICHKLLANKQSLNSHKYAVHVEDKYECEICGKRFKMNRNYRIHRATHDKKPKHSEKLMEAEQTSSKVIDPSA